MMLGLAFLTTVSADTPQCGRADDSFKLTDVEKAACERILPKLLAFKQPMQGALGDWDCTTPTGNSGAYDEYKHKLVAEEIAKNSEIDDIHLKYNLPDGDFDPASKTCMAMTEANCAAHGGKLKTMTSLWGTPTKTHTCEYPLGHARSKSSSFNDYLTYAVGILLGGAAIHTVYNMMGYGHEPKMEKQPDKPRPRPRPSIDTTKPEKKEDKTPREPEKKSTDDKPSGDTQETQEASFTDKICDPSCGLFWMFWLSLLSLVIFALAACLCCCADDEKPRGRSRSRSKSRSGRSKSRSGRSGSRSGRSRTPSGWTKTGSRSRRSSRGPGATQTWTAVSGVTSTGRRSRTPSTHRLTSWKQSSSRRRSGSSFQSMISQ